jgi:hypothetical protein
MRHAYLLFAPFSSSGAFAGYASTAGSTCGSLFGVATGAVATAVVLRVMAKYWMVSEYIKISGY